MTKSTEALLPEDVERLVAGRCCDAGMAKVVQHGDGISKNEFIIVHRKDNERALFPSRIGDWLLASTNCRCFSFCYWQPKLGSRAFALSAPQSKPSSGLFGDAVNHG